MVAARSWLLQQPAQSHEGEDPASDDQWDEISARVRTEQAERKAKVAGREDLVSAVNECLFEHDPIGLAAIGCPSDEYVAEAQSIVIRLPEASDVEGMLDLVHGEFVRWFGSSTAGPRTNYTSVARAIWQLTQML